MDDVQPDVLRDRQLRGLLLRMIYLNHNRQESRLNSTLLISVLSREGYRFADENVLTCLQDLRDRGYVDFKQVKRPGRGVWIFEIELKARGRDLCDGLVSDPAVQVD